MSNSTRFMQFVNGFAGGSVVIKKEECGTVFCVRETAAERAGGPSESEGLRGRGLFLSLTATFTHSLLSFIDEALSTNLQKVF